MGKLKIKPWDGMGHCLWHPWWNSTLGIMEMIKPDFLVNHVQEWVGLQFLISMDQWYWYLEACRAGVLYDLYSFFPTCQVRVVRFYISSTPPPPPPPPLQTSTASSWSQRSPLDLNSKPRIRVVLAGPEQQALDHSGPCRTLTTKNLRIYIR